jgi:putative membrane protein
MNEPISPSFSLLFYLIHWLVTGLAVLVTAKIVPGFKVSSYKDALIAAVIIGIANIVLWPILILLTLPLNILTLGLFTFVVNGAILKICAYILDGFDITSWFAAIIGAIVLSLVSMALHYILI